jgi:hypothetical protein
MEKRGQVAVFIIVFILIISSVGLFFVFRNSNNLGGDELVFKDSVDEVYSSFSHCLEESLATASFITFMQGGYYFPSENSFRFEKNDILIYVPYYIESRSVSFPSEEDVSLQISEGLNRELLGCIEDTYEEFDLEFDIERIGSEISLSEDRIKAEINFPLTINAGNASKYFNEFSVFIDSDYLKLYKAALEITEEQSSHFESICQSCIFDFSEEYDVRIDVDEFQEEDKHIVVYYLIKKDKEFPDMYFFAHKLDIVE